MKIRCLSASLSLVKLGLQNEFQQMTELSLPYTVTRPFGHRCGIPAWRVIVKAMNDRQIESWHDNEVMAACAAR